MPRSRSIAATFWRSAQVETATAGSSGDTAGMRVAVLDDYHQIAHTLADWSSLGVEVDFFDKSIAREQLPAVLAGYDTLVLMRERTAFPREVLERLPNLELVVTTGMRNASVDVEYLASRGVHVYGTGIPGYGAADKLGSGKPDPAQAPGLPSTIEVAWALILRAVQARGLGGPGAAKRDVAAGTADQPGRRDARARRARTPRKQRWSPRPGPSGWRSSPGVRTSPPSTQPRRAHGASARRSCMASSDVVSIHLVLSERTRGLIGMRRSSSR